MRDSYKGAIDQRDNTKEKRRCRSWRLRIEMGKDPATGKRVNRKRDFHGTYREAEQALNEWIGELNDGINLRANMTFAEAAQRWQKLRTDKDSAMYVAPNTAQKAIPHIKALSMHIGAMDVADVDAETVERCCKALTDGNSPSGKPLSGTYVSMVHQTGKSIYDWLIKENVLRRNPFKEASPPSVDTAERKAIPPERLKQLMDEVLPDTGTNTALLLDMMLGLRSCESCALDWSDVDFTAHTVSIKKSRDIEGVRNKTKTPAGMRVLPMTPDVESMLKRRRAILSDQFEAHGRDLVRKKKEGTAVVLTEDTPICCDSMGRRTNVHSVSSQWRKIRGMLDLDDYTPHELRHSYLSMLYANGCDLKVLQKIAGHSRYSTTADIYVHTTLDDMRSAMSI